MKATDIHKWQKVRRKGIIHYVGKYGSLLGCVFFLNDIGWKALSHSITLTELLISWSICLLSGLIIAPIFWLVHEYQYRQWFDKDLR